MTRQKNNCFNDMYYITFRVLENTSFGSVVQICQFR